MKKAFSTAHYYLAFVLSIVVFIAIFTPIIQLKSANLTFNSQFYEGEITSQVEPPETLNISLSSIIDAALDISDLSTVISLQAKEKELSELRSNDSMSESDLKRIAKLEESIAEIREDLGADGVARIEKKLEDKKFLNSLCVYYAFMGMGESAILVMEGAASNAYAVAAVCHAFMIGFAMLFLLIFVVSMIVLAIRLLIELIQKTIRLIKGFKDPEQVDIAFMSKAHFPYVLGCYTLITVLMFALVAKGAAVLSTGFILLAICVVIGNVMRLVNYYLNTEDKMIQRNILIKQGLTLVAMILALVLVINVNNASFIEQIYDDVSGYYIANAGGDEDKAATTAAIIGGVALAMGLILVINSTLLFTNFLQRLGMRYNKLKDGRQVPFGPSIAACVFLIICFLLPVFLSASSVEAQAEAFDDGGFKIILDAYKVEGTAEHASYEIANEEVALLEDTLDSLKEQYKNASGEQKESLKEECDDVEAALATAEAKVSAMETNQKSSCILCAVLALLILGLEIAYKKTPHTPYSEQKDVVAELL